MKKSFLQLKIVTTNLNELRELTKHYEDLGFISDDYSQSNDDGLYWTFLKINNGLVSEDTPEAVC